MKQRNFLIGLSVMLGTSIALVGVITGVLYRMVTDYAG